ncbi:MAG: HAAS signaling domain-containing protein [Lachnospiraceae bacterium]
MKKEEYLRNLKFQLIDFPGEDLSQIEDFYEELILDGIEQGYTEEEIISKMEAPEEVASKIRAEYGGIVVYTAKAQSKNACGYESSELIHTVRVETNNLRIRVKTTQDGPVRVFFKPREGQDQVTFTEENGIFHFHHELKGKVPLHVNLLNLFKDFNILVLELPVSFAGALLLQTTNGSIRVAGLGNLDSAKISSSNGMIRIENSSIHQLEVQSNNAKIELSNVRGNTLEAAAGNGLITAKECRFDGLFSLQTQNGAVTGRNIISDRLLLQTSNGFVTAAVIGNPNDYNINSTTNNGFNNLDNVFDPSRPKSLTAKTHNGRIQVEFI